MCPAAAAEQLAKDVARRDGFASSFTQYRRTVVVADTFVLAMADASAPIDAAALSCWSSSFRLGILIRLLLVATLMTYGAWM